MTGIVQDQQKLEKHMQKQMGCMSGFLQIFDRQQILNGKRLYTAKRLPSSVAVDSSPESEKTIGSPATSSELEKHQSARSTPSRASPDRSKKPPEIMELRSPAPESPSPALENQPKSPLPLPGFEFKEGTRTSWKFSREAPRLSLDSRATVDAKGSLYPKNIKTNASILSANNCESSNGGDESDNNRRSPSVIARLMGLEPLRQQQPDPEPIKKAELRRSASESRVSKDLSQYRFVDGSSFQMKQSQQQQANYQINISSNLIRGNGINEDRNCNVRQVDPKNGAPKAQHRGMGQRKCYYDSADFFPEPKQTISVYGEIEKRLKMRGIDEPSKDLETLKQILEALQLKGLLHPKKPSSPTSYRNFVYDRSLSNDESPIVVMRPARTPAPASRRNGNESPPPSSSFRSRPGVRRSLPGETLPSVSPRRDRREIDRRTQSPTRNSIPPTRNENNVKSPNRRRPLSIETQRKNNDVIEQRRVSPVQSPKLNSRRAMAGSGQQSPNRYPRNRKPTVEILPPLEDESSTVSESSRSTSSQTDTERARGEEYKEGKSLLERCDKLLHSIAEITATELQPSPVSVLDSSFYKDESSTSPIMKRSINFKDQSIEFEDDAWIPAFSPVDSKFNDETEDCDLVYISEILRAFDYLPEDSDIFLLLEKQQHLKGKDTSKVSRLRRRLIFDTIIEILHRNRQLPPWKAVSPSAGLGSLRQIWSEFRRIRERDESQDLFEVICGVLKKDLAGDAVHGWEDCPIEMSEAVLDIERLLFKDLIGETIRDLALCSCTCKPSPLCRKLHF
ncbi:hypothetical protein UlMin_031561 [Ulmus minor]